MIEGLGTTMDVVLVNGLLREGAQVVVCGLGAPIVTTIRSLLTPHPMKVRNSAWLDSAGGSPRLTATPWSWTHCVDWRLLATSRSLLCSALSVKGYGSMYMCAAP